MPDREPDLWDGYRPDPTLHQYDQFIERFRRKHYERDAQEWLADNQEKPRLIHEFDAVITREIVESVYARGANEVRVIGEQDAIEGDESIDMLLVVLPSEKENRELLFELSELVARESGLEGDVDEGQRYMLLRWT